jgi:hypothetical protein
MKLRTSNKLNMVGACLTVAHETKYQPVWFGQPPVSFEKGLATLQAGYLSLTLKASEAESSNGGATETKAEARIALIECAHVLARALAVHFKGAGDLTRLGQINLTRTDLVCLRENDLVPMAIVIRDIGAAAQAEPSAGDNGVSPANVGALTAAIDVFQTLIAVPRGRIVYRMTMLKEIETDIIALVALVRDLDDLVLQFHGSAAGRGFIEAWKNARTVVDRIGEFPEPTPSPSLPASTVS